MNFNNLTVWQRYFVASLIAIPMAYGITTRIVDLNVNVPSSSEQVISQRPYYGPAF
jgi:hypothetical protein